MNLTVVLAAGVGSRIHDLSFDRPKSLLSVGGVTLISRLCKSFSNITDKFLIVSGENTNSIKDTMEDLHNCIDYIDDSSVSKFGNSWSLKAAIESESKNYENVLILEADVILSCNTSQLFLDEQYLEKYISIPVLNDDDDKIYLGIGGKIGISKKTPEGSEVVGKYLGVGMFPFQKVKNVVKDIPKFCTLGYVDYLSEIISQNTRSICVDIDSAFEIDTKEDYKKVLSNPKFYQFSGDKSIDSIVNFDLQLTGHIKRIVGVHDVFGAKLVQNNGFDAIWLGSFQIALSSGDEDNSDYDPFKAIDLAQDAKRAGCLLPLILDAGNGFQSEALVKRFVEKCLLVGVAAICVEDNEVERVCSLYKGIERSLIPPEKFANRIAQFVKHADGKLKIIARTEALTIGNSDKDAADRLEAAVNAGADVVLPHYVDSDFERIKNWFTKFSFSVPTILIPTGLVSHPVKDFKGLGCSAIVYANIDLRLRYHFLQDSYAKLSADTYLCNDGIKKLADPSLMKAALDR